MLAGRGRSTLLRFMFILEGRVGLAQPDLGPRLDDELLAVIYRSLLLWPGDRPGLNSDSCGLSSRFHRGVHLM
jgi:hypothetical protein